MSRSLLVLLALALVVSAYAELAPAATPVSRDSDLQVFRHDQPLIGNPTESQTSSGSNSLAPYSGAIGLFGTTEASQRSSVSPDGATASLRSLTYFEGTEFGYNSAENRFSYWFNVSDPEPYSFTGLLTIDSSVSVVHRPTSMYGKISLTGPGVTIDLRSSADSTPFTYSGTLTPGLYNLNLETFSQDQAYTGGTVDLTASLVLSPEPSSVLMLAVASLLPLRRRDRRVA